MTFLPVLPLSILHYTTLHYSILYSRSVLLGGPPPQNRASVPQSKTRPPRGVHWFGQRSPCKQQTCQAKLPHKHSPSNHPATRSMVQGTPMVSRSATAARGQPSHDPPVPDCGPSLAAARLPSGTPCEMWAGRPCLPGCSMSTIPIPLPHSARVQLYVAEQLL